MVGRHPRYEDAGKPRGWESKGSLSPAIMSAKIEHNLKRKDI